jgi:hypothetical protein
LRASTSSTGLSHIMRPCVPEIQVVLFHDKVVLFAIRPVQGKLRERLPNSINHGKPQKRLSKFLIFPNEFTL